MKKQQQKALGKGLAELIKPGPKPVDVIVFPEMPEKLRIYSVYGKEGFNISEPVLSEADLNRVREEVNVELVKMREWCKLVQAQILNKAANR